MSHTLYQSPIKSATLNDTSQSASPKAPRFFLNKTYMNSSSKLSSKKYPNDVSIQLPDVEGARKEMSTFTKLPAVTDLINIRATHLDPEVNKALVDLTKYAQNLEHIVRSKDKEIEKLEYINKYLTMTQQSREQLLTQTLEENRKLKEMSYLIEKKLPEKRNVIKKSTPGTLSNSASKKLLRDQSNLKHTASYSDGLAGLASPTASEVKSPLLRGNKQNINRSRDDRKNQSVLQMNEEEVNILYSENENFAFLEDLLRSEELFVQQVTDFQHDKLVKLYDAIQTIKEDHSALRDMIFKLRRIVKATITMTTSLVLDEAIERIIDETCECLDCDRASTFIYDSTREELWSKKAKGSDESIRVPVNKGIVGHVFTKGEALNIHNAYTDERFNKQVDLKTGYKTTTMLTVPVKDDNGSVIGVVQAVNKKGMGSIFTKDDEALLTILSNLAGVVLRNSMTYNQQLSFHNVLRSALKTGVFLNSIHDLNQLLPSAEKKLKSLMGIERAHIVLRYPNKNELFSIISDGSRQNYPLNCGIVGKVVITGEYENIANGYGHPLFNGLVDIETSMPLLCVPINNPSTDKVMGAIQVINTKGIQGLAALQRANVDTLDKETLEFFSKQLAQAVLNCFEWERLNAQSNSLFQEGDNDHFLTKENLDREKPVKYTIKQVPPEEGA